MATEGETSVIAADATQKAAPAETAPVSTTITFDINTINDDRILWLRRRVVNSLLFAKFAKDTGAPLFPSDASKVAAFNEALTRNNGEMHLKLFQFLEGQIPASSVLFHLEQTSSSKHSNKSSPEEDETAIESFALHLHFQQASERMTLTDSMYFIKTGEATKSVPVPANETGNYIGLLTWIKTWALI